MTFRAGIRRGIGGNGRPDVVSSAAGRSQRKLHSLARTSSQHASLFLSKRQAWYVGAVILTYDDNRSSGRWVIDDTLDTHSPLHPNPLARVRDLILHS